MEHTEPSAFGTLARRVVAWIILLAVAVIALKIVFGIVAGLFMAIVWAAVIAVLFVAAFWALKRV
jgi:hypothetical protein